MKEKLLFIYSISLVVLLYAVHYFNTMSLFYVLIAAVVLIILKPIFIAPVYFISSLSGSFFVVPNGEGSVSRYLSVLLILSLFIHLIRLNKLKKKSLINDFFVVGLILFNFLSSATSLSSSFNSFFLLLQNLLILFLFSKYEIKNIRAFLVLLYSSAVLTISLILIEFFINGTNLLYTQSRLSINDEVNENRFGMMLVQLGVIMLVPIFLSSMAKIYKIMTLLSFPLILILIVLTGSRTSLIAYLLTFMISYLFFYKKFSITKFITILIIASSFYFIWDFLLENIPFMYRFSAADVAESGGSHRLDSIIILLKNVIPNHLLIGIGLGGENTMIALEKYGNGLLPAHNIVIDTLTQIGIIGFLLYFYLFKIISQKMIKARKRSDFLYLPILMVMAAFINGIGETVFFEKFLWNGLALGTLFIKNLCLNDYVQNINAPESISQ